MNDCGVPETSDSFTSFQSSPTVLSTIAQPCRNAFAGAFGSTMRYVLFHTGTSLM